MDAHGHTPADEAEYWCVVSNVCMCLLLRLSVRQCWDDGGGWAHACSADEAEYWSVQWGVSAFCLCSCCVGEWCGAMPVLYLHAKNCHAAHPLVPSPPPFPLTQPLYRRGHASVKEHLRSLELGKDTMERVVEVRNVYICIYTYIYMCVYVGGRAYI